MVTGLVKWAEVFGPSALDEYVLGFVIRQMQLGDSSDVAEWQKTICRLTELVLAQGMPMDRLGSISFGEATRMARNAETALLVMLSLCARCTGELSHVEWLSPTAAGAWLYRLQGQRDGPFAPLPLRHLDRLNLAGCDLCVHDLYGANLGGADLSGVHLEMANLRYAQLDGANLQAAHAWEANLGHASLKGANLEGANLEGANLEGANLEGANLEGANLEGVDLMQTHGTPRSSEGDDKRRSRRRRRR